MVHQSVFSDTDFSADLIILRYSKTITISLITSKLEKTSKIREKMIRNLEIGKLMCFGFFDEVSSYFLINENTHF